jgi:hypothetical protein
MQNLPTIARVGIHVGIGILYNPLLNFAGTYISSQQLSQLKPLDHDHITRPGRTIGGAFEIVL